MAIRTRFTCTKMEIGNRSTSDTDHNRSSAMTTPEPKDRYSAALDAYFAATDSAFEQLMAEHREIQLDIWREGHGEKVVYEVERIIDP